MKPQPNCTANHSYYVAEVVGVEKEGKVYVLAICTACGDARCADFKVAEPNSNIRLLKEEKQTGE